MVSINKIKSNQLQAISLAHNQLPELVCDAVNLEGIDYTLSEIHLLLDGVTVGGHKQSDQTITLNQANAWKQLFEHIEADKFFVSKQFACELHAALHDEWFTTFKWISRYKSSCKATTRI